MSTHPGSKALKYDAFLLCTPCFHILWSTSHLKRHSSASAGWTSINFTLPAIIDSNLRYNWQIYSVWFRECHRKHKQQLVFHVHASDRHKHPRTVSVNISIVLGVMELPAFAGQKCKQEFLGLLSRNPNDVTVEPSGLPTHPHEVSNAAWVFSLLMMPTLVSAYW